MHKRKFILVNIPVKAGVRDYSRAAAKAAKTIGRDHANDDPEPWLGGTYTPPSNSDTTSDPAPWLGGTYSSTSTNNTTTSSNPAPIPQKQNQSGLNSLLSGLGLGLGQSVGNAATNQGYGLSGGVGVDPMQLLQGLSATYIAQCVQKYNSGQPMSELERRVALAAISLQNQGKMVIGNQIGTWVMQNPVIVLGGLAVLVVLGVMIGRK